MTTVTSTELIAFLDRFAAHISEEKDLLNKLDAAIGDGDHGANLHRGLQAALAKRPEMEGKDTGTVLKLVATTLISTVGGASGALYGTFFLHASSLAMGKVALTSEEFAGLLAKGLAGVLQRGKAVVGDKTMIDVFEPAIAALNKSISAGRSLAQGLAEAKEAAEAGEKSTIPLVARKGRASYLGERSAGHQDPGATSARILFDSLAETIP
jgi:dihydroxyacetone kinase-like protein